MSNSSNRTARISEKIDALSISERHRLLVPERRRLVLQILTGEPPPVDLEGLATEAAAQETVGDTIDAETIKDMVISLHHVHLPALADADILAYDPEAHRIELGE